MGKLFGTDGVRGIANVELTAELAFKLGQAGAYVLTAETHHTPQILVGTDTRVSSDMLEAALIAGICSLGAEAVTLGIVPTPAVAYLTRHYGADAGIMVSASHNPFEFNGIKFLDSKGHKLSDSIEEKIEGIVKDDKIKLPTPSGEKIGRRMLREKALIDYMDYAKSSISVDLIGMKIVIDCANGALYEAAPLVFKELGAEVEAVNCNPDGININSNCGSTHIENLRNTVIESGAVIGLAFDGDADRVLAVDETGEVVDGDRLIAVIACELQKEKRLKEEAIVVTVMSNMGLDIMAREKGIKLVKTRVGDRYVLEEMLKNGYILGGEQSGHIIMLEHNTTGDGLVTALSLLQVMKKSGRPLSELARVMEKLPQVLRNAKVSNQNKARLFEDDAIRQMIKKYERELEGQGRVLIRPSGTEPLVRVMIEGRCQKSITLLAEDMVRVIEMRLQ